MTLEVRADTATVIVERELKTHINLKEGGSLLVKDVLAHKILESLGLKRASVWNGTDLESEEKEIYFKIKSERLEIQLKGAFFALNKDWLGTLNQVLGVIKAENLDYHFSRFDLLYITRENLFKELRRSKFKADPDIKYSKEWEPYWFRVFLRSWVSFITIRLNRFNGSRKKARIILSTIRKNTDSMSLFIILNYVSFFLDGKIRI